MTYSLSDRAGIARAVAKRLGIDSEAFSTLVLRAHRGERVMFDADMPQAERQRLTKLLEGARYMERALAKLSLNHPSVSDSFVNSLATGVGKAIRRDPVAEAAFLRSQR